MRIDLYHHSNTDPEILRRLDRIDSALNLILGKLHQMAVDFTRLETEVSENSDVTQSAITLLRTIVQSLREAASVEQGRIQAAVNSLADKLDAKTAELGAAVAENTPAAEEPSA